MKPSRLATVLDHLIHQRWPAFVWGPPGIGKSSIVREAATRAGLPVLDLRAALLDPTDLRGIPSVVDGKSVWCPPSFLPRDDDKKGLLFLDEINAAPPMVQASLYQLVLDRRIGDYVLPDGWSILAAGNRSGDRSITFRLSSALANRFVHLQLEVDFDDWRSWAISQRIHPTVIAFLSIRPALLSVPPEESHAYPTPRSWEMLSDVLHRFETPSRCADIVPGIVGEGASIEFLAFSKKTLQQEALLALVESPDEAPLPQDLDSIYLLTNWLAYNANQPKVYDAVGKLIGRLPPEFGVILVRDVMKSRPEFAACTGYRAFVEKHASLLSR